MSACPGCGSEVAGTARFCPECGTPFQPRRDAGDEDELRPVTVLFADIVGSTALGERLAPDEVKALVGECVSHMSRAVEEYGGTVQAYQGDGICAYFGVPVAHEDDPERAARAGLRILEIMREYARDVAGAWGIAEFDVRVGINTGQAAVGLVGGSDRQAVALGDATNVAARLQSVADPGTIAVGDGTARRVAHRFDLQPLGEIAVKGRTDAVVAHRLAGPRVVDPEARPPPFVDREAELARLRTFVDELRAGRGQILLISGEAGIGKTRLLAELRTLAGDEMTWLQGQCLSYGGLPSWPFMEILRAWLGVEEGDVEVAVRTKARAKLGAVLGSGLVDALPALGRLLRIRLDPELEDRLRASPDGLAVKIRRAYLAWLEALAEQGPVVLTLEDLQWADASTRELAEAVLELTERAPLLVVVTLTQDRESQGWPFRLRVLADFAHRASEVALAPLPDDASRALLAIHLPGIEGSFRDALVARAEGNPLFLEELARSFAEGGDPERRARTWTVTIRASDVVPPALENVLVARIDRLPDGPRRLAHVAAVIGRAFPVRVLERVCADQDVQADLGTLLRAEIVREVRRYPDFECTFRHGLFQEAALSTLTRARRRELYVDVARAFEELFASSLDDHLERLAHYHAQAEDRARALQYIERAAERATELDERRRATELWGRARKLAAELADNDAELRAVARIEALRL